MPADSEVRVRRLRDPPSRTGRRRMNMPSSVGGPLRQIASQPSSTAFHCCELCAAPLAAGHEHLVEPSSGKVLCACGACSILFTSSTSARYKRVPRRARILDRIDDGGELWASLSIPVDLVFFFLSSPSNRVLAIHPSAGGPTSAEID